MTIRTRYDDVAIGELLEAGHTNIHIARALGVDPVAVGYIRRRLGYQRTNQPISTADVLALRSQGLTIQQTADRLGYSHRTVDRAIRRARETS
ncbi:MAG: helix-turn-helix domain-containing protein [Streptomyces sp.]|jgi:DNA-binding CsgD family transcriptional regulator|nr:helix-turn-helix domain-containing protein [Streptomyces sp.]